MKLVREGTSIYKASELTGVPQSTIGDRFIGRVAEDAKMGCPSMFSEEEEQKLIDHVKFMSKLGYSYSRSQFINLATDMADFLKKRSSTKPLSHRWLHPFKQRWPELSLTKQSPSKKNAETTSSDVIQYYYSELGEIIHKYDFHQRPEAVYQLYDTSFSPEHQPQKVCVKSFWLTMCHIAKSK